MRSAEHLSVRYAEMMILSYFSAKMSNFVLLILDIHPMTPDVQRQGLGWRTRRVRARTGFARGNVSRDLSCWSSVK